MYGLGMAKGMVKHCHDTSNERLVDEWERYNIERKDDEVE